MKQKKNLLKKRATRGTKSIILNNKNVVLNEDEPIRINKFIASTGVCSRREADNLIAQGKITVNGKVITELGAKVLNTDDIKYNGKVLKPENYVYVLLNKPKDTVTTLSDPHAKRTVIDLVKNACRERIFPVGRLDKQTTGVLLLTNDGDLTEKLTHPSYNKLKIYQATLDKDFKDEDFNAVLEGFELEDGFIKADDLSIIDPNNKKQIGIEIHSGRNRIVRRIFEHVGYKVIKLDRVYFAGLTKKGLQRGHWRHLSDTEVASLKMGSYK
jgi:23S rRNA pseudouridine2605 synthase